ncbi:RBP11-like subunits of RNA polymerase [Gautieria morchelliformis]|nr:RBP11-like subunits of RNA polymerase [Gautieria morchelliformis]
MDGSLGKLPPKVSIVKGASPDLSAATYIIRQENHTLGNALRWMLMKNPNVEFCGYSVPHPSEENIQVRIQMYDNQSSLPALLKALDDLDDLFRVLHEKYKADIAKREYERFHEMG